MIDELNISLDIIIRKTQDNAIILTEIIAIPWSIYLLNCLIGRRLLYLGIIPRHIIGLIGIPFAPLLHANFNHLFFNTIPLLILSNFILIDGMTYYLLATSFIVIVSGILIWCFSKPGIHVGASGLITGYWALLVSHIVQQETFTSIILGLLTLYYLSGIFWGIFPSASKNVSWEGHFFGLLAGLLFSYYVK